MHNALDSLHPLLDDLVHLSSDCQTLLWGGEFNMGIDRGARLVCRREKCGGTGRAERACELESADLGAPATPSARLHAFVEIRS
jgi:hypothetical protein